MRLATIAAALGRPNVPSAQKDIGVKISQMHQLLVMKDITVLKEI